MSPPGSATRLRRSLAQRPFLLFALLLCLPALAFGLLGWRSVGRENAIAVREAEAEAEDVLDSRLRAVANELETVGAREAERPYFHYQTNYAPEATVFKELDFQTTPLIRAPGDPRILFWFQWELGAKGVPAKPQVYGSSPKVTGFQETYGPFLRAKLAEASGGADRFFGRRVDHALRTVQLNEERGQLIEEMQILRQQQVANDLSAPAGPPGTPYLENFYGRVGDEPVGVRYGAFRYAATRARARALGPGPNAPTLVAWRILWIPAEHAERREVSRHRWLLQGYALAPEDLLPAEWETVGKVQLCRLDAVFQLDFLDRFRRPDGRRRQTEFLTGLLDAELVPVGQHGQPSDMLALVASPDADALYAAHADARTRFLLLFTGVLAVVGVGFVVLTRGLRREIQLARRKEDFVAAVSHELKTPLAGIRMYADMLREGWVSDEESANRYASRIIDESDRLGHLVDQVLDLAALERGVARANAMPGDLGAAVREAAALSEAKADQQGVALEVDIEDDLPSVTFDPRLVRPLVLNLIDNAVKYSEHAPEKEVRVSLHRDGETAVVLEVADRGVGVDPKVRRHLFEPFHRAGDEMTRSTTGVGIGLALVKRYAEAHRAKVTLDSEVGRGTTVRVRFAI